jgi:hypothetical protein
VFVQSAQNRLGQQANRGLSPVSQEPHFQKITYAEYIADPLYIQLRAANHCPGFCDVRMVGQHEFVKNPPGIGGLGSPGNRGIRGRGRQDLLVSVAGPSNGHELYSST